MKTFFFFVALLLFFLGNFVLAHDDQPVSTILPTPDPDYWTEERMREAKHAGPIELVDPREVGILPDSPFYFAKSFGEKIRGLFIFSEPARLKYQLKIAERRLSEAHVLLQKGKGDAAAKAIGRYQNVSDRINKRMEDAVAKGRDLGEVKNLVIEARAKHIQVLERVLERVPEQAKDAIQKVIEREREKIIPGQPSVSCPEPTPCPSGYNLVYGDPQGFRGCPRYACVLGVPGMPPGGDEPVVSDQDRPSGTPAQRPSISWEDCIKIPGSKILPTFPEQCAAPDGRRAVSPPGWRWPEASPLPTPPGAGAVPGAFPERQER